MVSDLALEIVGDIAIVWLLSPKATKPPTSPPPPSLAPPRWLAAASVCAQSPHPSRLVLRMHAALPYGAKLTNELKLNLSSSRRSQEPTLHHAAHTMLLHVQVDRERCPAAAHHA